MQFVDQAEIYVKAGDGGDGSVSFRREKYVPKGGPNGGRGGNGGDVIIQSDSHLSTLLDLVSKQEYHAGDGEDGGSRNRTGADGEDVVVKVPVGTIVRDKETGLVLKDCNEDGISVTVAKGGKGGRGNASFATPTNQAPRECEDGRPGQERHLKLDLKIVASVGLIGKPNSGKSTLLSRISAAHPKIAGYPFTTLQPQLGIVDAGTYRRFTVAEVPGLIEGAHEGKGLGDEFLRHIERTKVLVHLVDLAPSDGTDPVDAYRQTRQELARYSDELADRPEIVVGTKLDLDVTEEGLERLREGIDGEVLAVSSVEGTGLKQLLSRILDTLDQVEAD